MARNHFRWVDREKVVELHYIDGVEFPNFHKIFKPAAYNPNSCNPHKSKRAERREMRKEELGEVTALHFIAGIDFPMFHEPAYPLPKEKQIVKDPRGERYVRRSAYFTRQHQHQRDR